MVYISRKDVAEHLVATGLVYPSELGPNSYHLSDGVTVEEVGSARTNFVLNTERRLGSVQMHAATVLEHRKRCVETQR